MADEQDETFRGLDVDLENTEKQAGAPLAAELGEGESRPASVASDQIEAVDDDADYEQFGDDPNSDAGMAMSGLHDEADGIDEARDPAAHVNFGSSEERGASEADVPDIETSAEYESDLQPLHSRTDLEPEFADTDEPANGGMVLHEPDEVESYDEYDDTSVGVVDEFDDVDDNAGFDPQSDHGFEEAEEVADIFEDRGPPKRSNMVFVAACAGTVLVLGGLGAFMFKDAIFGGAPGSPRVTHAAAPSPSPRTPVTQGAPVKAATAAPATKKGPISLDGGADQKKPLIEAQAQNSLPVGGLGGDSPSADRELGQPDTFGAQKAAAVVAPPTQGSPKGQEFADGMDKVEGLISRFEKLDEMYLSKDEADARFSAVNSRLDTLDARLQKTQDDLASFGDEMKGQIDGIKKDLSGNAAKAVRKYLDKKPGNATPAIKESVPMARRSTSVRTAAAFAASMPVAPASRVELMSTHGGNVEVPLRPRVLSGLTLRAVANDKAWVSANGGAVVPVSIGESVKGAGIVHSIRKVGDSWAVVADNGIILP